MTAPGQAGVREDVEWRRVHKITPVLNAWKVLVAIIAVLVFNNADQLRSVMEAAESAADFPWGWFWLGVVGSLVVVVAVTAVYSAVAWRRMRYAVGDDAVYLHRGIFFRSQRHARLNRIQAVDVVQPLLGRLFGLAQLKIETAGGQGSNVTIAYLREAEAQALRNEILARASGAYVAAPATPEGDHPTPLPVPAAPERELLEVTPGRLVASLVRSGAVLTFFVFLAALVVAAVVAGTIAPLTGAFPGLVGWGAYVWSRFAGEFGFRVALSPDGIRLRHGLLETRAQTLPPGRVQAIRLTQPLLWRRKGWWRVDADVAGYGGAADKNTGSRTVLLPVGDRGEALTAMWLVLPDLGEEPTLLDAALEGDGEAHGFITSPRSARVLDPIVWRRTGLRITRTALFMRTNRLNRSLIVVPHERTQSLGLQQGPLERRLGLADFVAHTVPGPFRARVPHLEAGVAGKLLLEQAQRARGARAAEGPEEWALRVGVPAGPDGGTMAGAEADGGSRPSLELDPRTGAAVVPDGEAGTGAERPWG